jgi:hypothetical protein
MTLITKKDWTVAVTVQTRAVALPQHAFEVNVPIDLSQVFTGWGLRRRGGFLAPVHISTVSQRGEIKLV